MERKTNLSALFLFDYKKLKRIFIYSRFLPSIISKIKNWPTFLLGWIGLVSGEFECVFRNGIKIKMNDILGTSAIFAVLIKKDYGDIEENSTVIDIGANIGAYSIFAALKNNIVYAFEPEEDNFELLKYNIKTNNFNNIFPYKFAVTGKKEKRNFYLGRSPFHSLYFIDNSPLNISLHKNKMRQNITSINCISLEDIFLENKINKCDMLKIDCEGAEFEILYNLKDEYYKKIKKIRLEYHNHRLKEDFVGEKLTEFLENKGFKMEKLNACASFGLLWFLNNESAKIQ